MYLFCLCDCILQLIVVCIALVFLKQCIDEVPIQDSEAKLISEFVESVASIASSEFQKESSTFGSLSGHEGDVSLSVIVYTFLR